MARVEESVEDAFGQHISGFYRGHQRVLRTAPFLRSPTQRIPEPRIALALLPEQARWQAAITGTLAYLTNIAEMRDHVTVVQGRMADDNIRDDPESYPPIVGIVEAVIGETVAESHDLHVGDVLTLATSTSPQVWTRVSAQIVGIVEPIDPAEDYWQGLASVLFDPPVHPDAPDLAVEIDAGLAPAALIITSQAAMLLPDEIVEMSRRPRRRPDPRARRTIVPEPKVMLALSEEEFRRQAQMRGSLGYLMHLRDLQDHVTFVEGRMAGDAILMDPETFPRVRGVEAVVGAAVARMHDLQIGESLILTSSAQQWSRVSATIVGVVEATDPNEDYWRGRASAFFDPPTWGKVADLGVEVDLELPPAVFIITPDAAVKLKSELVGPPSYDFSRGTFASVSGLEEHVTLREGRLAVDTVERGPEGPLVEAVLGWPLSREFAVNVGDVVTITPFIDEPVWVSVRIVGIVERDDVDDEYWVWGPSGMFKAPDDPNAPIPSMPLFVGPKAMIEVGETFAGVLVNAEWFTYVDKEGLKQLTGSDIQTRLAEVKTQLSSTLPGQQTITGLTTQLRGFERRSFLTSVPLLLLLTTMVVTVLYFLSMMVSYLVRSRERDVAALKTRGVSVFQLVRLYGTEGLVIAAVAALLGPFIAMGATALSGKLPYFRLLTGGDTLPVEWRLYPFLAAAGAGLLCYAILLAPAMMGARTGDIVHRLRSSRLPSVSFFHRYYIDLALPLIGGLVYWELRSREELVVGGLFRDAQINESLLLAPVLFLTAVALLFMRFFPLVLRFVGGESPALLHLVVSVTLAGLGAAVLVQEISAGNALAWAPSVALLAALAGAYWATQRARRAWPHLGGLAVQAAIVALFVALGQQLSGALGVAAITILVSIVPAQLAFLLFKTAARAAPAWVSLAIWHMARNPSQYTWLVLLLVLVAGLATFSTTMGATLDRRDQDRIFYDVPSDLRVTGIRNVDGWALRERYQGVAGIESVSPAFRGGGAGLPNVSRSFKVLAVESQEFASVAWYRDDFSNGPLEEVMRALRPAVAPDPLVVPEEATGLGVWAKLAPNSATVSLEMVLRDDLGTMTVLDLGKLTARDWRPIRAILPAGLQAPLHLMALRVRPVALGVPARVLLDEVHATVGPDGEERLLIDFEVVSGYVPLPATMKPHQSVLTSSDDVFRGEGAALYSLGPGAVSGGAGIYLDPRRGPLPVAVSSSFAANPEVDIGTTFIGTINNTLVPMVVVDSVDYFPTMHPEAGDFLLADLGLLAEHLSILDPGAKFSPNEYFLTVAPGAGDAFREGIRLATPLSGEVLDRELLRETLFESVGLDPLVTAGWRAMALLSLAIVVFAAGTGYIAYLLLFADRSRVEMHVVRSMGLQQRQMIGLLALEHIVIVLVGLGLGAWSGLQMSKLTVPAVSLMDTRGPAVPPILITTDWSVIVSICGALVASFAVMIFLLKQRIFNSDLHAISRTAEG